MTLTMKPARREAAVAGEAAARIDQFITFTIGEEEYGVDIMDVREIKGWTQATRLPNSPNYVRGVVNLRGIMVPVLDLRARFGMGRTEVTKTHVVVIVTVEKRVLGLLVDAVSDILSMSRGAGIASSRCPNSTARSMPPSWPA